MAGTFARAPSSARRSLRGAAPFHAGGVRASLTVWHHRRYGSARTAPGPKNAGEASHQDVPLRRAVPVDAASAGSGGRAS